VFNTHKLLLDICPYRLLAFLLNRFVSASCRRQLPHIFRVHAKFDQEVVCLLDILDVTAKVRDRELPL
jgi:hypothetical protein